MSMFSLNELFQELGKQYQACYEACAAVNSDSPRLVAENLERLVKAAQRVSVATGGEGDFYDVHDQLVELESALTAMGASHE